MVEFVAVTEPLAMIAPPLPEAVLEEMVEPLAITEPLALIAPPSPEVALFAVKVELYTFTEDVPRIAPPF